MYIYIDLSCSRLHLSYFYYCNKDGPMAFPGWSMKTLRTIVSRWSECTPLATGRKPYNSSWSKEFLQDGHPRNIVCKYKLLLLHVPLVSTLLQHLRKTKAADYILFKANKDHEQGHWSQCSLPAPFFCCSSKEKQVCILDDHYISSDTLWRLPLVCYLFLLACTDWT